MLSTFYPLQKQCCEAVQSMNWEAGFLGSDPNSATCYLEGYFGQVTTEKLCASVSPYVKWG